MQFSEKQIQLEAALLKALAYIANYNLYRGLLNDKRLMPQTLSLLNDYALYYKTHNADIDWSLFYTHFSQDWHKNDLDDDDITLHREHVFPFIQNQEDADVEQCIAALKELKLKDDIEKELKAGNVTRIQELLQKHNTTNSPEKQEEWELGDVDLSVLDTSKGVPWALPSLQAGLKSKMPGQFIVVAADNGMGKSAFCITDAVHALKWLYKNNDPRCILYCTSEDTKEDLDGRIFSNLYNKQIDGGFEEVIERHKEISTKYIETFGRGKFRSMQIRSPNDLSKIKHKIDTYKPCVVYIDMLDVLAKDMGHEALTQLYNTIRSWANAGLPIVGTTQSGNTQWTDREGETHSMKWLTSKHMAGSKSGKQGAAYCAIMIGGDDSEQPGMRYINTTKKKRGEYVAFTAQLIDKWSLYRELL